MSARVAPFPVLIGPTASGKSALALAWAEGRGAHIVSADSRQIYRGMATGTAQPLPEEMARVPHHFVGTHAPDASFSAAAFAREAEACLAERVAMGQPAIVVGGSTMYLSALVHGLSPVPDVPDAIRAAVQAELESRGLPALVEEVKRADPVLAATLDLHNPRRVQRALEVYRATGRPLSHFQGQRRPPRFQYRVYRLAPSREALFRRIERRVDEMIENGLVDEVRRLLARYPPTAPGLRTIGYAEVAAFLSGEVDFDVAITNIKKNTRRYARRQETYFNKYFGEAAGVDPARAAPFDAAIAPTR